MAALACGATVLACRRQGVAAHGKQGSAALLSGVREWKWTLPQRHPTQPLTVCEFFLKIPSRKSTLQAQATDSSAECELCRVWG